MGIHDLEVDRVGTDIEDSKAHEPILMMEILYGLNPTKYEAIICK
jgi:hypothetical protein